MRSRYSAHFSNHFPCGILIPMNTAMSSMGDSLSQNKSHKKQIRLLADVIETILHGTERQKENLRRGFFLLAYTPKDFKSIGLTGSKLMISYGKISRHRHKDKDLVFSCDEWRAICRSLGDASKCIVTKYNNSDIIYNIFLKVGRTILIGVEIPPHGEALSVHLVRTVFRKDIREGQVIVYPPDIKKLTPAQRAVLAGNNLQQ